MHYANVYIKPKKMTSTLKKIYITFIVFRPSVEHSQRVASLCIYIITKCAATSEKINKFTVLREYDVHFTLSTLAKTRIYR